MEPAAHHDGELSRNAVRTYSTRSGSLRHAIIIGCAVVASGCAHSDAIDDAPFESTRATSTLTIRCIDKHTGQTVSAWGFVTRHGGRRLTPNDDPHLFMVPGGVFLFQESYTLEVRAGDRLDVTVERGFDRATLPSNSS